MAKPAGDFQKPTWQKLQVALNMTDYRSIATVEASAFG